MLNVKHRELLSHHYIRIWFTLLDSLANSEHIDDFSEFQHHETMCRQICNALCKLMTLITKDDLSQLQEAVMKYYGNKSKNNILKQKKTTEYFFLQMFFQPSLVNF